MPLPKLLIITGKGGVGKSAVAAALAHGFSLQNKKTALIELAEERLKNFDVPHICIKPDEAFREYATQLLGHKALYKLLLDNRLVSNFIHATPGLNEILCLGKLVALAESDSFDQLILDAPATGHTVALFDAPRIALAALQHGLLKKRVQNILRFLHDPLMTGVVLVTLPEELPVEEGLELYQHLQQSLNLKITATLLNGCAEDLSPDILRFLEHPPEGGAAGPWVEWLRQEQTRQRREKELIQQWQTAVKEPTCLLPWIPSMPSERQLKESFAAIVTPWISNL